MTILQNRPERSSGNDLRSRGLRGSRGARVIFNQNKPFRFPVGFPGRSRSRQGEFVQRILGPVDSAYEMPLARIESASAAVRPAAAPTPSDHRGPATSATQPTTGAPIGVPPSATASRKAITLPRIAGSVESCMRLLLVLVNVSAAAPITISAAANVQ